MKTSLRSHLLLALLVMLVTFGSAEPVSATEKVSYNYGSASYFLGDDVQGAQILASGQAHKNLRLVFDYRYTCLLYTSPSPRDQRGSRMPSSA